MAGLHEVVSSPPAYEQLLQLCRGGTSPSEPDAGGNQTATADAPPTFMVVPALEFVGASSPEDPRIHDILRETDDVKRKAADLVVSGEMQAFHAGCFPEGHRQTNLNRWAGLEADAAPYEVKYAEGYEPYGFLFRRHAPPFDERFRGFGLDKVTKSNKCSICSNIVREAVAIAPTAENTTRHCRSDITRQQRSSKSTSTKLLRSFHSRSTLERCTCTVIMAGFTLLASPPPRLVV